MPGWISLLLVALVAGGCTGGCSDGGASSPDGGDDDGASDSDADSDCDTDSDSDSDTLGGVNYFFPSATIRLPHVLREAKPLQ